MSTLQVKQPPSMVRRMQAAVPARQPAAAPTFAGPVGGSLAAVPTFGPMLVQRCGGDTSCGCPPSETNTDPAYRQEEPDLVQRCNDAPEPCPCHGTDSPAGVPPVVGEVLRTPGEALPRDLRATFEASFAGQLSRISPVRIAGQPKARISQPGDPSERQAEEVASRFRGSLPSGASATGAGSESAAPDFRAVRVHTGPQAARAAKSVSASAYTVGNHIVLAGPLAGHTQEGRGLLAHELTHVVQQGLGAHVGPIGSDSTIHRMRCPHDGQGTGCYASPTLGWVKIIDEVTGTSTPDPIDKLVVENMQSRFGGTWLRQVKVPPNAQEHQLRHRRWAQGQTRTKPGRRDRRGETSEPGFRRLRPRLTGGRGLPEEPRGDS